MPCGFASTACLQIDDTKVVSGDGSAVRLWSHATGRRIATLPGHTGEVHMPPSRLPCLLVAHIKYTVNVPSITYNSR